MKITIKTALRYLPGLLLLAGVASCTSEVLYPGYGPADKGSRSPMRIELGVSTADVGIRTRAAAGGDELSDAFASSKVKSLWVGVFDVQTDSLVGQMHEKVTSTDKTAGFDPETGKATVDILYYDAHPTLRVYGVANYDGVKARKGVTEDFSSELGSLLKTVKTLADFYTIAVDANSANDAAIQSGAPLMMGVFKLKNEADYHTVEIKDDNTFKVSYGNSGADVTLNDASVGSMYDRIDYAKFDGTIRLRRLLSQVNVTVASGNGITVSNLRYRKVNMPNEVYLQERQTYTAPVSQFEKWTQKSPNKADATLTWGTEEKSGVNKIASAPGYESDRDFGQVDGLSFSFHQYENKHWGFNVSDQNGREEVRTDLGLDRSPIFLALNPYSETGGVANDYNNFASYFEIQLDVVDNNENQRGTVTYRIHEGRCNDENDIEKNPNYVDFSCVRNTIYNYTITINGLSSIDVKADTGHGSHPGIVNGTLWDFLGEDIISEEVHTAAFSGKIEDYIVYYANGGNDPVIFGLNPESELRKQLFGEDVVWDGNKSSPFLINGSPLEEPDTYEQATISFDSDIYGGGLPETYNPRNYRYELYILTMEIDPQDGCKIYKYQRITYYPEDKRSPLNASVDFNLAFANEWDAEALQNNGAVVDHIKEIKIPDIKLISDVEVDDPIYTIYLNEKAVWTGRDFAKQNLYDLARDSFSSGSIYTVQIGVSDDNYSEVKSEEKTFVVYPTSFEWSYRNYNAAYFDSEDGTKGRYFGSAEYKTYHESESGDNNYFALYQQANNMQNGATYLQTGGNRNVFHIDPLYDAVLTVYAVNNTDKAQYEKCLTARYSDSNEEISQISVGISTAGSTPFTFYIEKDKGGVDIFSSAVTNSAGINGNVRIYTVKLDYNASGKKSWKFSDSSWSEYLTYLGSGKTNNRPAISTAVNGLGIFALDDADLRGESGRIYLGNTGSKSKIGFFAHKSGLLQLEVAGGSETKRMIQVETGDSPFDENNVALFDKDSENAPSVSSTSSTKTSAWIEIDRPTMVYVSVMVGAQASNGTYFYSIEYDETVRKE